jgi:hypothetical protein
VIPRPQQALADLAMKLALSIAPETQTSYAAANAGMIAMLLNCLAQEFDRAAAVRTQDLDEMNALFTNLPAALDPALAADIAEFSGGSAQSLRIEHLNARHGAAMELLIRLHTWAEEHRDAALDQAIWGFLARHADRHAYQAMI